MNFEFSNKVIELQNKLTNFMNENVYKNEEVFEDQLNKNGRWTIPLETIYLSILTVFFIVCFIILNFY